MDIERISITENDEHAEESKPTFASTATLLGVRKENSSKSRYVVGMLIFLVVALICGLTYFVLKDRGIDLLSIMQKKTETNTGTGDQNNNVGWQASQLEDGYVITSNKEGWSKYSLDDYGLYFSLPKSFIMTQKVKDVDYDAQWEVSEEFNKISDDYFDNYIGTVYISLKPQIDAKAIEICAYDCIRDYEFTMRVYTNQSRMDIGMAKSKYVNSWQSRYGNISAAEGGISVNDVSKWEREVLEYRDTLIEGGNNGYVIVTDTYIYDVATTGMSERIPSAAYNMAWSILDSLKFSD